MIMVGRVVSGFGEGGKYVEIYMDVIEKVLGIKPYPGTLNVEILIGNPEILYGKLKPVIISPPGPGYGEVYAYKARLNGIVVFLVRPAKTRHDIKIVEVISDKYIRGLLNLRDGDQVIIEVDVP